MKRLFFLFVLVFIGTEAYTSTTIYKPNYQPHNSLKFNLKTYLQDTIPEKRPVDEWYNYRFYMDYSGSWDHTVLQDQLYAPFTYSGHGFSLRSFEMGVNWWNFYAETNLNLSLIFLRPSDSYQREIVKKFTSSHVSISGNIGINLAYRVGKSSHYAGLNFRFLLSETYFFYGFGNEVSHALPSSSGLFYGYYGKIRNTGFRASATLPIFTNYYHASQEVKNVFNPTVQIDCFARIFQKRDLENYLRVFYTLDYLNYTYEGFNYRHRRVTHSIGMGYNFGTRLEKL